MDKRFDGTTLIPKDGGTPEDQNKAILDLLGKINEVAGSAASDSAVAGNTGSLAAQIKTLSNGSKYGLEISYIASDTLSVKNGMAEVTGELAVLASPYQITNTMANFPSAGAWAYVTIEAGGAIRLFQATGAATARPTDNCYLLTGGGVGFDDIKKGGYYFDSKRRIIGAIHKVNATTWYIIMNGAGVSEVGANSLGDWERTVLRGQKIRTAGTSAAPVVSVNFPIGFSSTPQYALSAFGTVTRHLSVSAISATAYTPAIWNAAEVLVATQYSALFEGKF